MPIIQKHHKFLVRVQKASAAPGFQRISKSVATLEEAQRLEREINECLDKYGRWPHSSKGTLREAAELALKTHWEGMRSHRHISFCIWPIVTFMEDRGRMDLDDITSEDVDALLAHYRSKGLAPSYINQQMGILRVVNKVALKRLPPLASRSIPTPHVKGATKPKWWMRPEQHKWVCEQLRSVGEEHLPYDPLFADIIDIICFQGLRIEETLRLSTQCVSALESDRPWLHPDGTKTDDAGNSIPIYPEAVPVIKRCIERSRVHGWGIFFPINQRQAANRWAAVREALGVQDIPTATMKALRRTFACYANTRKMPTATLQKVLRHKTITTTSGYLDLVGNSAVDESREYFSDPPPPETKKPASGMAEMLAAFRATGATPEEVARFAKELMA